MENFLNKRLIKSIKVFIIIIFFLVKNEPLPKALLKKFFREFKHSCWCRKNNQYLKLFIKSKNPQNSSRHQDIPKSSPKESYLSKGKSKSKQNSLAQEGNLSKGGRLKSWVFRTPQWPCINDEHDVNFLAMKLGDSRSSGGDGF